MLHVVFIALIAAASLIKLELIFYWTHQMLERSGGRYPFQDVFRSFLPVEAGSTFDAETTQHIAVLKRYDFRANIGLILFAMFVILTAVWIT